MATRTQAKAPCRQWFVLNFRELNDACDRAAEGTVLNVCEPPAMTRGAN